MASARGMSTPATLQDVADRAGVHRSTVALALRDHPRIPEATRVRIKAVADQLGYRVNPFVAALMQSRRVGRTDVAPFVAVNNLFSEKYSSQPQINAGAGRFFNPLPGVNYVAGIRLNW